MFIVPIIYTILFYDNRKEIPDTRITIKLSSPIIDATNDSINHKLIREIQDSIENIAPFKDQGKLIEVFDKERSRYIELFTIISILLTVFGALSISASLIDRSKLSELQKDLEDNLKLVDLEIKKMKLANALRNMISTNDALRQNIVMYSLEGKAASNYNELSDVILVALKKNIETVKENMPLNDSDMLEFAIETQMD
jgi:hypothetical protein